MKQRLLGLAALAIFLLSSCGSDAQITTQYTPLQIATAIIEAHVDISEMQVLHSDDNFFTEYVDTKYDIEVGAVKDGVIFYCSGAIADEIAVFLVTDNSDVKKTKDALKEYKKHRAEAFMGYAPEQAAILENGLVVTRGNYVALLICKNPKDSEAVFISCFSDNPPEIKNNKEPVSPAPDVLPAPDVSPDNEVSPSPDDTEVSPEPTKPIDDETYNPDAIIAAWRSGDKSGLSSKNRSILDDCVKVIEENITEDMSDYEKELAINDWIVGWADYDREALSSSPDAKPDTDNDNPYGVLSRKKSICSGYTSTFRLFMDLLDIECISVSGIATHNGGEHAWNMVRIDGKWYCVDVTWNDPIVDNPDAGLKHKYFNVTSQFMRETGHNWDEETVPIADSGKLYLG